MSDLCGVNAYYSNATEYTQFKQLNTDDSLKLKGVTLAALDAENFSSLLLWSDNGYDKA